jgi:hypothetical protein
LFEDTNIGNGQYNNLDTLFYAGNEQVHRPPPDKRKLTVVQGYIIGQVPGHYLMQRVPLGASLA